MSHYAHFSSASANKTPYITEGAVRRQTNNYCLEVTKYKGVKWIKRREKKIIIENNNGIDGVYVRGCMRGRPRSEREQKKKEVLGKNGEASWARKTSGNK